MRLIDADALLEFIHNNFKAEWDYPSVEDVNEIIANAPTVQQSEPFGYFKAEPFGWTDCAETDEGAIALYELPQPIEKCEPAYYAILADNRILETFDSKDAAENTIDTLLSMGARFSTAEVIEFYTSPQPRDWVSLTKEQEAEIIEENEGVIPYIIHDVSEALKQLNTKG